jgi:hypothetical protein
MKIEIGKHFGKLTVIKPLGHDRFKRRIWLCQCECGNTTEVVGSSLTNGLTHSCGCGRTRTKEESALRKIYYNMKHRCYLPSSNRYNEYGGRGIIVCEEWNQSLNAFREWALNNGYQLGLSLERIDVNGNYEPSNCTWITRGKQQYNKTNTIYLTYNNETHNLMEWADITGINYHCLKSRYERGWETERILTQPKQKRT